LTRLATALNAPQSIFAGLPLDLRVARALSQIDVFKVPDMPDRIIAATALHLGVPLISRDAKIQASNISTIW
jgi:PIN domain nuclease of toxin-antitoxin system